MFFYYMDMNKHLFSFKLIVTVLALLSYFSCINQAQASSYLPPRLSLDANAGGSAAVGQADLLLSLKGNEQRNLYLNPQASYGTDEQWYADLGLGYRWIQNDAAILGGYVFASRSQVANQKRFWIVTPGVEALGSRWDARINGYISIGGRSDEIYIRPQLSQLVFIDHTGSVSRTCVNTNKTQQIGDGVDAKVAYQLFRNVPFKAYFGAYFFDIPHTNNVRGGAAGLEYWFDHHVKAFVNYTYDNLQYNTVVGGLALSFGGVGGEIANPSLSERLTDPVERYLANLGHGSGLPSKTLVNGGTSLNPFLRDIAFFSQTGTPNNGGVGLSIVNCTFANPCGPTDFSQIGVNTLSSLLPNTVMYFSTGTYSATNNTSALTLNSGQSVWGRSVNYSEAAVGVARPTFNGAFILVGNNILDSISLNNSLGARTTAIRSNGGQNLAISNSTIGRADNPYGMAMDLTNASAALTKSDVNSNTGTLVSTGTGNFRPGILLSNSSLVVQSSKLNVATTRPFAVPTGVFLSNKSSLTLDSSELTVGVTDVMGSPVMGVVAFNTNSVATINNSSITVNSRPNSASTVGLFTSAGKITMNGGAITVSGAAFASSRTRQGTNISITNVICTRFGAVGAC
jgi:hypothetical protein